MVFRMVGSKRGIGRLGAALPWRSVPAAGPAGRAETAAPSLRVDNGRNPLQP